MVTTIEEICKSDLGSTLSCEAQYILAPDVILLLISDGTARLLDLGGYFYAISATGTEMLEEVLERDTASAASRMALRYGVDVQQIHKDLKSFLEDLKKRGLVRRPNSRWHLISDIKTFVAFFMLFPALYFTHCSDRLLRTKAWILLTLGYISIALFGWATTVTVWQRYYRKVSELQSRQESEKTIKTIDEVVRAVTAKHFLNIGCKERALCCWDLIRSAGLPAKLVLGVDLFPLASHCWCEFGSQVLSDYEDRCERFTPILCYE
ncbi:hypothetical protein NIES593_19635 [Hydrococcus rivularis NIES-593]|uniref:Microcin J25-processing protein McjB C-terminal domain-containing protein n=1 Tax=Hydrococcus rivularis NIES-593 TaxID=1921803 RepID=A0A1U7H9F5_9CYAN|nr:lasso peptide biosynthesis B2 protein [Hydrococcus rivularis]OKH20210.1 hypothetical protein NIES593_19635 [Hydrococcus rivularis NIES-593]